MFVHGSQPDLVLTVRLQLGQDHAVAVGEGGGVGDERQVVPGGGVGVGSVGLDSLQVRRGMQRIFCINLCQ